MLLEPRRLSCLVRRLLEMALLAGIPLTLGTPFLLKYYYKIVFWMAARQSSDLFLIVLLMSTGFMLLVIVWEARKILLSVDRNLPFVRDNVVSLQRIAISSLLIGGAYMIKSFLFPTFLTIVIALITLVVGLFVSVMAQLFDHAVMVKEENDLTV